MTIIAKVQFIKQSYAAISLVFVLSLELIFLVASCALWRLGLTVLLRSHSGPVFVKGRASMKRMYKRWGRRRAQVQTAHNVLLSKHT